MSTASTNSSGVATVNSTNVDKSSSISFTVSSIGHATLTYEPDDNWDPDGDSNGTTITVVYGQACWLLAAWTPQRRCQNLTQDVADAAATQAIDPLVAAIGNGAADQRHGRRSARRNARLGLWQHDHAGHQRRRCGLVRGSQYACCWSVRLIDRGIARDWPPAGLWSQRSSPGLDGRHTARGHTTLARDCSSDHARTARVDISYHRCCCPKLA